MNVGNVSVARGGGVCWDQDGQQDEQHFIIVFVQCWIKKVGKKESQLTLTFASTQLKQFHKIGYKDAKMWMEQQLAGMK